MNGAGRGNVVARARPVLVPRGGSRGPNRKGSELSPGSDPARVRRTPRQGTYWAAGMPGSIF